MMMIRILLLAVLAAAVLIIPAIVAAHVASRNSDSPAALGWCYYRGGPGWYRC